MGELRVSVPDGGVVYLVLDRPERRNALSTSLRDEITAALAGLAGDEAVKVVVVTGAGSTFCAGFDLGELADDDPSDQERLWASSDRYHHAVLDFPLPTVAAVNGPALGGGFDLAVLCDVRLAATTARFAHPEHAFGDVVYGPLHDLVGGSVARDLCLTGRSVDAGEALRLHLVSEVHEPDALPGAAADLAARIAVAPRDVLVRTKAKARARARVEPGLRTLEL